MRKIFLSYHAAIYFLYLFIFWGLYRLLFVYPESLEEVVLKPLVWLIPLALFLRLEGKKLGSLGLNVKNLFPAIYIAIGLGIIFTAEGVLFNYLKYNNSFQFAANLGPDAFLLSFVITIASAISEELAFRGFIFTRLNEAFNNEWVANLSASIGWTLIHVPIALRSMSGDLNSMFVYLFLVFIFGIGASWIYARTKNIAAPILLHLLWEWPIILFR